MKLEYDIFQSLETDCVTYSGLSNTIVASDDLTAKTGIQRDFINERTDAHTPVNDIAFTRGMPPTKAPIWIHKIWMNMERNFLIYVSLGHTYTQSQDPL